MLLYQGQPGTSTAALYTSDRKLKGFAVVVANTTGSTAVLTLNVGYAGAAAANTNRIASAVSIDANAVVILEYPLELQSGDVIRGLQGTSAALTVTIDGTLP